MKTKRLFIILISVAFVLITLFSVVVLFSVKKVQVDYAVLDKADTVAVQERLDEFCGENLLFLDVQKVKDALSDFHYMEVVSVDKSFPNVVDVKIKERREVYDIEYGDKVYVTTETGFVLCQIEKSNYVENRKKIKIELDGIEVQTAVVGQNIKTTGDALLNAVFEMAVSENVNLTNCIKAVRIEMGVEKQKAIFYTYSGVKIVVGEILDDGVKKIEDAFVAYDKNANDYEKTFKNIIVTKQKDTGYIRSTWTWEDV